jgi:NAD(P)-dependent dehydrogenase (short-subunit alcohol dehydrogenase family)
MDLGLAGSTVLVTGASKGIGLACAEGFAAEGCHLHLAARSTGLLEEHAARLRAAHGVRVTVHATDLRTPGAADALAEACAGIDILVNNAGDIPAGSLTTIDETAWRHAWELKVFGYINLSRAVLARMQARGSGVVVNVIGMAGVTHPDGYICGAVGNAALDAFTKAAGKGSIHHGVRVLGVHPGATLTDRIVTLNKAMARQRLGDESRWEELLKGVRMQQPSQVADTVVFLASPRSSHLSGVMLNLTPA